MVEYFLSLNKYDVDLFYKDLSNCASSLFQQNTQISSISNAIEMNPARMIELLGYHAPNNKQTQKLETIYENVPSSIQNVKRFFSCIYNITFLNSLISFQTPLNFHMVCSSQFNY